MRLTLNHFIPVIPSNGATWHECCKRAIRTNKDMHPRRNDTYDQKYESTWTRMLRNQETPSTLTPNANPADTVQISNDAPKLTTRPTTAKKRSRTQTGHDDSTTERQDNATKQAQEGSSAAQESRATANNTRARAAEHGDNTHKQRDIRHYLSNKAKTKPARKP